MNYTFIYTVNDDLRLPSINYALIHAIVDGLRHLNYGLYTISCNIQEINHKAVLAIDES